MEHLRQIGSVLPILAQSIQMFQQQPNLLPNATQTNAPALICQSPSEERQQVLLDDANNHPEEGQKSPRLQLSPIPQESRENRSRSAQSQSHVYHHKRSENGFDGSSTSSLATIYYPLKNGSGLLNSQECVQRRIRTTTISGI